MIMIIHPVYGSVQVVRGSVTRDKSLSHPISDMYFISENM